MAKLSLNTVWIIVVYFLFLSYQSFCFVDLDFTKNNQVAIFNRGLPVDDNCCVLTMEDDDFVRLTYHKFTLEQVFSDKIFN